MTPARRTLLDRAMDALWRLLIGALAGIGFWAVIVAVLSVVAAVQDERLPEPLVAEIRATVP
jgi:hypothetical protein